MSPQKCPLGHTDCAELHTKMKLMSGAVWLIATSSVVVAIAVCGFIYQTGQWKGGVDAKLENIERTDSKQTKDIENLGWVLSRQNSATKL